jgi:hypothetical protein
MGQMSILIAKTIKLLEEIFLEKFHDYDTKITD